MAYQKMQWSHQPYWYYTARDLLELIWAFYFRAGK